MNNAKSYRSVIFNSSIGNILEWYDFGLFTIFSALFSKLFFPVSDSRSALLATFSVFAVGFLCRPIGALIFGYLGDTVGRAKTLRLSVLMISLPTLAVGLLPTYQQIGVAAPIMLLLIRMWQGISIGGEYSGNLIYLAESAPNNYRATCTSFVSMGSNVGILLSALVGIVASNWLSESLLESWGWRIPYLMSGLFCLIVYFFRLQLQESQTFEKLKQAHQLAKNPIKEVFKYNFPQLMRTLGLVCMGSTFYMFCFVYIPIYVSQNHHGTIQDTSVLMSLFIALMIVFVPIAGLLCDRVGRRKMLLFNAMLIAFSAVPGFYFLQYKCFMLLAPILLLFTVASSLEQGTTSIAVVENFPAGARYTGVSLGYNLGNGLLGGTVPMICEWLLTNSGILGPAIYIALCALLTGLVVYFFVPETKHTNLLHDPDINGRLQLSTK